MQTGLDRLLAEPALRAPLAGRRVALLAHPASVTADLTHALDALAACGDLRLAAVTEKVESLFVITQLVKVFKEYETVDRAVESF